MYVKLVLRNVKRSIKDYLIYVVTMTICVTLFYAFLSISSKYYHPDVGTEYNFTLLNDGMKMAICAVTLLLLFLIRYVNNYMLRRKQKEFAIQSVMGMEQKTVGWLFFAETFVMGAASIVVGICLGALCSQFITAMLLASYDQNYQLSWTLFPDTVSLTICFFVLSFFVVGMFNIRTIRKIKIVDMLYADKKNESALKKSIWMPAIVLLYEVFCLWVLINGIQTMHYFYDNRFALPVRMMFWGNIIVPAMTLLWVVIWIIKWKKCSFHTLIRGLILCSILNTIVAASVPKFQSAYYLSLGTDTTTQCMVFVLADLFFFICGIIYLVNSLIIDWKEKSPEHKYSGHNLFFLGQITSKLATNTKTMTLICITLVAAIFLFIISPVLTGWSSGYLDIRSKYDVQISTKYNNVYEEEDLPTDNYDLVTDFLIQHGIEADYDCTFNLYLAKHTDFYSRVKSDFPVVAISLSDYNTIRKMLGYDAITLNDSEFTTQWQSIATENERDIFLQSHFEISTDTGALTLADHAYYEEPIGETVYNSYTNVLYVFPDSVCQELLPVIRNRYIITDANISYEDALTLEHDFSAEYPEGNDNGVSYTIRMKTLQINSTKASNFVLKATMIYGAIVLMVICLTILSLQQLLDANHYRYRFSVLRKLGVEDREIGTIVLKQLGVWFGLPIVIAILVSGVIVMYFIGTISAEIAAYIGLGTLLAQVSVTIGILALLLVCYFISTWILFKKSISE